MNVEPLRAGFPGRETAMSLRVIEAARRTLACLALACGLAPASPWVSAAAPIETRPVQFAKGASSATMTGTIAGDKTVDYKLRAKAGQTMSLKLTTSNPSNYFNVLPPGSKGEAIFVGSSGGNEWRGVLAADGEYKIRVYLMRNAARRNEKADFTLDVSVAGKPSPVSALGRAPASDAKLKGTQFHATGQLPCWMGNAPEDSARCPFSVVRGSSGNADVRIKPEGGLERLLTFRGDRVTSGNEKVKATRSGDTWTIEVNDYEHYRVYDSVIFGG
jgi:hypothetical protein